MQMNAQTARLRGIPARTRTPKMQRSQGANWWFRIGLAFSLVIGAAWGCLLGIVLVRVNAQISALGVIGAALPAAFAGSMITGLLFNWLVRKWHKVARLLAALMAAALGMPLGIALGLSEQHLDAVQLFSATGAFNWNIEWFLAMLGLIAGMWPGWTKPLLRFLGRGPLYALDLLAHFFETMGHAFLWAPSRLLRGIGQLTLNVWHALIWVPSQLLHGITRFFQNLGQLQPPHLDLPQINMPRRTSLPREATSRVKRRRFVRPKAAARGQANNGDGLRVVSVVEDRCPYCLDVIKRNDPRGVRTCDVCGTPHHADCWSITGKCQVPHLNA
jgi:hypothetical protein